MSDLVKRQVEMLRKQCLWQRQDKARTDKDTYPYHKHYPDCDICRSAELIEHLQSLDVANITILDRQKKEIEQLQSKLSPPIFNIADHCTCKICRPLESKK